MQTVFVHAMVCLELGLVHRESPDAPPLQNRTPRNPQPYRNAQNQQILVCLVATLTTMPRNLCLLQHTADLTDFQIWQIYVCLAAFFAALRIRFTLTMFRNW